MPYSRDLLLQELRRDEGERPLVYDDATGETIVPGMTVKGWATAGVGHNLSTNPLPQFIITALVNADVNASENVLDQHIPWWRAMTDARQRAMLNLSFMGWGTGQHGLSSFTNFLSLMESGSYQEAADDLLQTAYARQVGQRANRIADLIRQG